VSACGLIVSSLCEDISACQLLTLPLRIILRDSPTGRKFGSAVMFLFPYTHFLTIWSNFLGYTGMPDRTFSYEQASMSSEELAIASLPVPPDEVNAKGTSLFPQSSTLNLGFSYEPDVYYFDEEGNRLLKDNCPAQNASEFFCPNINQCTAALSPARTTSPSMNQMLGYLVVLAVVYTVLAAYWALVFPGAVRPYMCLFIPWWRPFFSTSHFILPSAEWRAPKILLFLAPKLLVRRV